MPQEFLKLKYYHIRNIQKKILHDKAVKDKDVGESMRLWAQEVSKKGMAAFRDESDFEKANPEVKEFKTSLGVGNWSFTAISAWQRDVIKRDGLVLYLDSTHSTCYGMHESDKVYLFTLLAKSSVTGRGCPVAFSITNLQRHEVIADFLQHVKEFSQTDPKVVVIDCDDAEKRAIHSVWPSADISLCRWHVLKACDAKLKLVVRLPELSAQQEEAKRREIGLRFREIMNCDEMSVAEDMMTVFLHDFREFPKLITYVKTQ